MARAAQHELEALLEGFEPLPADILTSDDALNVNGTGELIAVEPITYFASSTSSVGNDNTRIPSSSSSSRTRDLTAERRARHRARSRNEVQYLREVVSDLERQLDDCKQRVSCQRSLATIVPATQAKVWKALAVRQRLERNKAEAENARLRVLLDNQLRFAVQLQHLIAMREVGSSGVPSTLSLPRVDIDEADVDLLETYLSELDAVYARTDDVLRETGVDLRPETTHRVIRMRNSSRSNPLPGGEAGSFVEFMDTHLMESNLATARKNSWAVVMHMYLRRSGMLYTPPGGSHPNTVLIKFRVPCRWLGRDCSITITHSLKIFDEPDRQVNVYRVLHVGEGGLAGMATDETGWSILTPSTTNLNRTVCRCVARQTPMRFHRPTSLAAEHSPPQLVEFARVLVTKCDEDFGLMLNELSKLSLHSTKSDER